MNKPPELLTTGFLREKTVLPFVGFSRSTLWNRVKAGTFPKPIKLSERVTVWRAEDIRLFIENAGKPASGA